MQQVPDEHWVIWNAGDFTGPNRPVTRVAIQRGIVSSTERYTSNSTLPWRSALFNKNEDIGWKEIPQSNLVRVNIDRRLGNDAATMSMVMINQVPVSPSDNLDLTHAGQDPSDPTLAGTTGPSRRQLRDLGQPGYYTYNRGVTPVSTEKWGHGVDPQWMDEFIPNRKIVTFQGYGTDGASYPWNDSNLVQTGVWLIDKVRYTANGEIVIECRDLAKLLIEQRLFPPIVPLDDYPLTLQIDHTENTLETITTTVSSQTTTEGVFGANVAKFPNWDYNNSNAYWFSDKKYGGPCGHGPQYCFDGDKSTYWLSVANNPPTAEYAFEWVEADCGGNPINRIKIFQRLSGYLVYLSVMVDGVWQGTNTIPYNAGTVGAPNNSDIKYVHVERTPNSEGYWTFTLPQTYQADRIRVTLYELNYTTSCPTGVSSPYRGALSDIQAFVYTPPTTEEVEATTVEDVLVEQFVKGNIRDYTDIVKLFCAWAGFYWPDGSPTDWIINEWSGLAGRVWGDWEYSGAYPVEPPVIDPSFWDNKSLMDGINQIKEILGFVFYIDSTGGAVWRSPNIWQKGNFVTGLGYRSGEGYIEAVDEDRVLIDYGVLLDDSSLRSEVIVVSSPSPDESVSVQPGWGIFRPGSSPSESAPEAGTMSDLRLLGGQERVTVIPDYPFASQGEIQKFGYLVTLWMHWSFRKSKFRVPGIAALEPDDQIRIYERVTSEAYVHYINGVSSSMDLDKGTWYLDLDTNWLGNGPGEKWIVDYTDMSAVAPTLYDWLVGSSRITPDDASYEIPELTFPDGELIYPDYRDIVDASGVVWPDLPTPVSPNPIYDTENPDTGTGSFTNPERGSYAFTSTYWGTPCINQVFHRLISAGASAAQTENVNLAQTNSLLVSTGVWAAFRRALIAENFRVYDGRTTSYDCRNISGSDKWSNHAWGIAIDVNAFLNDGWGFYRKASDGRWYLQNGALWGSSVPGPDANAQGLANALASDVRLGNASGTGPSAQPIFGWGGDWTNTKDYMHYEVIVTPEELQTYGVYYQNTRMSTGPVIQ